MRMVFARNITTTLLAGCYLVPQAQEIITKYSLGISAGSFIYQGDLTPSAVGSFKTPGFVLGLNASRFLTNRFSARLDLNIGRLKGDDAAYKNPAWRQQRNFAFTSPVTEVTGSVVWDVLSIKRKFSPYVFAGLGYSFLKIKRDYSNFNAEYFVNETSTIEGLTADANHSLPGGLPIAPVGLGVRYRLNNSFSLNAEASYRDMSSDYLDGFSRAANADQKDHYYKFSIGLTYTRNKNDKGRLDCPKF